MPFYVHRDVICKRSSVFKAAFSGEFTEASNQSMDLPDDEIKSVERMTQWLYTKQYELATWDPDDIPITANTRYWQLAKLNTLADKYNLIGLSNDIVDQLYIIHSKDVPPQLPVVTYVYENTTKNSAFRKLLIAWYSWEIDMNWYQDANARESLLEVPEFAVDLAIAFGTKAELPAQKNPFLCDKSMYYQQPEKVPTGDAA